MKSKLIGCQYNRLFVVCNADEKGKFICRCDCGNKVTVNGSNLASGRTKSCGCLNLDTLNARKAKINKRYGRLSTIKEVDQGPDYSRRIKCRCDCGNICIVDLKFLNNGGTKSCGCLQKEKARETVVERNTTHGLSRHPLYSVYRDMLRRCYNKKRSEYKNYGGRGVKVCKAWCDDFKVFFDWAIENGWEKGLTIEDNERGYYPSNCIFIPLEDQSRNRRNVKLYLFRGVLRSVTEIAKLCNIPRTTFRRFLDSGMNPKLALKQAKLSAEMTRKGRLIQRNTIIEIVHGEYHTLNSIAKEYDIAPVTLRNRIRAEMTLEEAVDDVLNRRKIQQRIISSKKT